MQNITIRDIYCFFLHGVLSVVLPVAFLKPKIHRDITFFFVENRDITSLFTDKKKKSIPKATIRFVTTVTRLATKHVLARFCFATIRDFFFLACSCRIDPAAGVKSHGQKFSSFGP